MLIWLCLSAAECLWAGAQGGSEGCVCVCVWGVVSGRGFGLRGPWPGPAERERAPAHDQNSSETPRAGFPDTSLMQIPQIG